MFPWKLHFSFFLFCLHAILFWHPCPCPLNWRPEQVCERCSKLVTVLSLFKELTSPLWAGCSLGFWIWSHATSPYRTAHSNVHGRPMGPIPLTRRSWYIFPTWKPERSWKQPGATCNFLEKRLAPDSVFAREMVAVWEFSLERQKKFAV